MATPEEHKAVLQKFASTHKGKPLNQKALLKPNAMIQKVLIARFTAMTPEQQQALKGILTPDTAGPLKALLPEISQVIDRTLKFVKRGMRNNG